MAFDGLFKFDRAAKLASTHAGREVTTDDFVEAAARGRIALVAICPRAVTMKPCREADKPLVVAEHGLPTLPLAACQQLQVNGHANWRTIDGVEQIKSGIFEGQLGRFDRWKLPEAEPDISITLDDCRVRGYVIHALADSSFDNPAPAPSAALPAPAVQVAEASRVPGSDVDAQAVGFIDESVPAPDQSAALPGPVASKSRIKRGNWLEITLPYIAKVMKDGQYTTAKGLFYKLEAKTSEADSPFEKGTGNNLGKLYIRSLNISISLKTLSNRWPDIIKASK